MFAQFHVNAEFLNIYTIWLGEMFAHAFLIDRQLAVRACAVVISQHPLCVPFVRWYIGGGFPRSHLIDGVDIAQYL